MRRQDIQPRYLSLSPPYIVTEPWIQYFHTEHGETLILLALFRVPLRIKTGLVYMEYQHFCRSWVFVSPVLLGKEICCIVLIF